jgi:hypothetical protein
MVKTLHFAYVVDQTYTVVVGLKSDAVETSPIGMESSNV